ncbi:hypothetical protein PUNSTDRAFT_63079 [Punctularia strigosozonata HHB-11173 SS5]|uniref:uncharacterized protein n=1 Tax=Punctularia strigosozonata (strain HHB-11173) TaxID=741275 RepID=UPI000441858F|nr:uncharacterized protein PUNSTDRAFT_63079 [Punctularia strigosozonata HHB-11173 SS5]EIN11865.1 hypothetical protein PUNSTDRAFT_63079 [Punctularia strigosozonata HHB-11173 SS5]
MAYTGGADTLVRIWRTDQGPDQEPDIAIDAVEGVTCVVEGKDCWLSGSEDAEVRRYLKGKTELDGLVTSVVGVSVRSLAIDLKGNRVAVTSDDSNVKLIDLDNTSSICLLSGHSRGVRRSTWHPSGSILATSGSDGLLILWDTSSSKVSPNAPPSILHKIDGIIPKVVDTESPEFMHDCSAVWHPSGSSFFVASRTHDVVQISKDGWNKTATFTDENGFGAYTALALSPNGVYLAAASQTGVCVWSCQSRCALFRFSTNPAAPVLQLAFCPTKNILAWVDADGGFSRVPGAIPTTNPDPVKPPPGMIAHRTERSKSDLLGLFDDEATPASPRKGKADEEDAGEDINMVDLDDDNWILDDLGEGAYKGDNDEAETDKGRDRASVREMVSVTKAQPPFQPGSTPMENRKRYLAYNTIGVIEVTDQDTHHIVNVEFHDRSTRKSYHFQDHFKYDRAAIGERGAVFACQPENEHPAHVIYKPYGTWASQSEWTYELPQGQRVLGVAAGGPPPTKSLRVMSDGDLQGNGFVVVASSAGDLTFLSGGGVELHCIGLDGDFVSLVAGPGWVLVIHREGSTTMDGSQNLKSTLISSDDFCVLQEKRLPIPKGHTLKWVGVTEEGVPAIYDSSGMLHIMPRFRVPLRAVWSRLLDTNALDRRQGKDESYWPVGVTKDTFMCLILKGRQEHPGFPRPLIQEVALKLPFRRVDKDGKDASLEEHFARETMMINVARDALGDDLTTEDISKRELALDKELILLLQGACKNDKLARAIDLVKLLHHNASFDTAVRVAQFYHLPGLQEKIEALKEDREEEDRLVSARDKRRAWASDVAPIPDARLPSERGRIHGQRSKPFQDFGPAPPIHRPGLSRATPAVDGPHGQQNGRRRSPELELENEVMDVTPDGKRKRSGTGLDETLDSEPKRRAMDPPGPKPSRYLRSTLDMRVFIVV